MQRSGNKIINKIKKDMKKLIAIAAIIIASVTTAQVNAQSKETAFEKELIKFVDSTVNASGKNLTKLDRFKDGCYTHVKVKKFGEADTPYSRAKAHSHNITSYTADSEGNGNINPEKYGIEFVEKTYASRISKILNDPANAEANYDSYYFTIVTIKGSYYLVFAMGYIDPVDTDAKMNEEFKKASGATN
jgi:hypothetical protein